MTDVLESERDPDEEAWTQTTGCPGLFDFADSVGLVSTVGSHVRNASILATALDTTGLDSCGAVFVLSTVLDWTDPPTTSEAVQESTTVAVNIGFGFAPRSQSVRSEPLSPQGMVRWLYEESGLTWEQLGRMFGVSRRSVHAWSNGQKVSGKNLERLSNVFSTIRAIEADSPTTRRHAIFNPAMDGRLNTFDELLVAARKAAPPRDEHAFLRRLGVLTKD